MPDDSELNAFIEKKVLLTPDVLALIRLPVPVSTFSHISRAFPDAYCQQRGERLCLIKPPSPPPTPE
jgi:hypothetical protein